MSHMCVPAREYWFAHLKEGPFPLPVAVPVMCVCVCVCGWVGGWVGGKELLVFVACACVFLGPRMHYGVTPNIRLLKMIGLFGKRAL